MATSCNAILWKNLVPACILSPRSRCQQALTNAGQICELLSGATQSVPSQLEVICNLSYLPTLIAIDHMSKISAWTHVQWKAQCATHGAGAHDPPKLITFPIVKVNGHLTNQLAMRLGRIRSVASSRCTSSQALIVVL